MTRTIALVRAPDLAFARVLSLHPEKHLIDVECACAQHARYVSALEATGIRVTALPPLENCPDAPFVEDTAVIFDDRAVACPMKEKSRREEGASVLKEIRKYRQVATLPESAALDGGDVLNTGNKLFVGISTRTNREGADALSRVTGKPVIPVPVLRGLHLKTAATFLGEDLLVIDSSSVGTSALSGFRFIETGESDRYAANCLAIGKTVLMPTGFPRVAENIRKEGFETVELEMSEFEKADGGLTCLSIVFDTDASENS